MNGTWNGARVAAAIAKLKDAGMSEAAIAKAAGASRATANRWARGANRPDHDSVRRLAAHAYRRHPGAARELVEASGYPWTVPQERTEPLLPPEVLQALERAYKGKPGQLSQAVEALEAIERGRRGGDSSPGERRAG